MRPDVERYQYFLLADEKDRPQLPAFDGRVIERWRPPRVFSFEPRLEAGDLWGLNMLPSSVAMTPETVEALDYVVQVSAQVLPLPYDGRTFGLLNVTECVDCLDHDATEHWIDSKTMLPTSIITKYAFRHDRLPAATLFKIPETAVAEILAHQSDDPEEEEEFKTVVERLELRGLRFQQLWSDTEGGVELFARGSG